MAHSDAMLRYDAGIIRIFYALVMFNFTPPILRPARNTILNQVNELSWNAMRVDFL